MIIAIDPELTAREVVTIRELSGRDHDIAEWEICLPQNMLNVSARNSSGEVIGVGFLCGNQRHAELIDLVVHPDYHK